MSSVKLSRSLTGILMGGVLLVGGPALADTLVVRSSGPSAGTFPPGKKLADGGSVTLKNGDMLTLLDGQGTRTLRGPGVFGTSAVATGGGVSKIAAFIGTRTTARSRTGAVRGPEVAPRSPNVWLVDITKPTTMCVVDAANLTVWRPDAKEAATLAISGASGKGSIAFEESRFTAPWPADLPVIEGASYQLSGAGLAKPVTVRFTLLDQTAMGLESTTSSLIARKCDAQIDLLVEAVALPDPAPDG